VVTERDSIDDAGRYILPWGHDRQWDLFDRGRQSRPQRNATNVPISHSLGHPHQQLRAELH
jgi:hypothetical protein